MPHYTLTLSGFGFTALACAIFFFGVAAGKLI